jgi:hypothetical protein
VQLLKSVVVALLSCAITADKQFCFAQANAAVAPTALTVPYATVKYPDGSSLTAVCYSGIFERVGVLPDQVVQVAIQYDDRRSQQQVSITALDGGAAISAAATSAGRGAVVRTDEAAKLTFTFQAGHEPGMNQVSLRQGGEELGLQFWIVDPKNPGADPTVLTAATSTP